jgi:hypothetical protein
MITGEVDICRHMQGVLFIIPGLDGSSRLYPGHIASPTMALTGNITANPTQQIAVPFPQQAALPHL